MRRLLVLALVGFAVASCTASADETGSATVVLFDVSNSTRAEDVRARYGRTFAMVLEHLRDDGGVLGADIVDANPLAHGSLPINETFEPCTITDNSLDCREAQDEQERRVLDASEGILESASVGTDVFGALTLASQFFEAYPEAGERTVVLLSDMVQFANGIRLGSVERWSPAELSALLEDAPTIDLTGVRVYVVGAGATTTTELPRPRSRASGPSGRAGSNARARRLCSTARTSRASRSRRWAREHRRAEADDRDRPVTVPVPEEVPVEEPVPAEPEEAPAPVEEPARGTKR